MIECTIDTHVLADLLKQYSAKFPNAPLEETKFLTKNILDKLNICIESDGFEGVVVASTFAFIEIINQFQKISDNTFTLSQLIGIISQPPNWLIIEPYDEKTVFFLISVPKYNIENVSIELLDAIHVATALQRGPNTYLATHDGTLRELNYTTLGIKHLI